MNTCLQNAAYKWKYYYPSSNAEECGSYGIGCRTEYTSQSGLLESAFTTLAANVTMEGVMEYCATKNGTVESLFKWTKGKWAGGKIVRTAVVNRTIVKANEIRRSLNFTKLEYYAMLPASILELNRIQNLVCLM